MAANKATGANVSDDTLASFVVGRTATIRNNVINIHTGDSDTSGSAKIVLPAGIEIIGEPEVVINRSRESTLEVTKTLNPGYIGMSSESTADVKAIMHEISEKTEDEDSARKLRLLSASIVIANVLDASTHASIDYKYHIEGHKYGRDGFLDADLVYKVRRAPVANDFASIMLELAKLPVAPKAEDVAGIVDKLSAILSGD